MHNILEAYIESRCNERGRRVGYSMKRDKASEDGQSGLGGCLAGGECLTVFYKGGARYYCWGRRAVQMWLSRVSAGPLLAQGYIGNLHVVVRMDFAVADFPANALEHWPDMCVEVPLVDPGEGCNG